MNDKPVPSAEDFDFVRTIRGSVSKIYLSPFNTHVVYETDAGQNVPVLLADALDNAITALRGLARTNGHYVPDQFDRVLWMAEETIKAVETAMLGTPAAKEAVKLTRKMLMKISQMRKDAINQSAKAQAHLSAAVDRKLIIP